MWKSDDDESNLLESVVNWASPNPPTPQCSTASLNSCGMASTTSTGGQVPPLPPPSPFSELFPHELLQSSGLLLHQFDDVMNDSTVGDEVSNSTTGNNSNGISDVDTVNEHELLSTISNGMYRCTECKFSTDDRRLFMCHKRSKHAGEKTFSCPDCSAKFTRQYSLKKHVLQKHPTAPTMYSPQLLKYCPFPNCKFATKNTLSMQLHKRSHQQLYFCKECNCRYTSRQSLLGHLTRHHGSNAALIGMGPSPAVGHAVGEQNAKSRSLQKNGGSSSTSGGSSFTKHQRSTISDAGMRTIREEEEPVGISPKLKEASLTPEENGRTVTNACSPSRSGTIDDIVGSVVATASAGCAPSVDPSNSKFLCDKCKYVANSLRRLYAHKLSAHRGGKEKKIVKPSHHICPQCPRKFASLKRMLIHVKKIHSASTQKEMKRKPRAGSKRRPPPPPPPATMKCDQCEFSTSRKRVFAAHVKSHAVEDGERTQQESKYDSQHRKLTPAGSRRITPDRNGTEIFASGTLPSTNSPTDNASGSPGACDFYIPGLLAKRSESDNSSANSNGSVGDNTYVSSRGLVGQLFAMNRNRDTSTASSSSSSDHTCTNRRLLHLDLGSQSTNGMEEMSTCLQGIQQANTALLQLLRRRENELKSLRSNVIELLRHLFPNNQAFRMGVTLDSVDEMVSNVVQRVLDEAVVDG